MIDKLELRTDNCKDNAIVNLSRIYNHTFVPDKNYRECHVFRNKLNLHVVTIKLKPVFENASYCTFEFNPSKIGSFIKTNELISSISKSNLSIKRIDYAVDVNFSIEAISKSLKVKNKRARYDYKEKDNLTGIEFGSDHEIICIYDKAYELLRRRKYRLVKGFIPKVLTRIEIRHRAKKIPFKDYSEILNYSSINPFSILEFYKVDNQKIESEYEIFKASRLLHAIHESGCLHGAIKRLNINNNFKRDNSFLIRDLEFEKNLELQFKENLKNYFRG